MHANRSYTPWNAFDASNVTFALGLDRSSKTTINMLVQPNCTDVAIVSPACVTNWPRVTGDGNFGTMWGPTDVTKAKFTLDLTDAPINGIPNEHFASYKQMMDAIDDKLLDFVHNNQLKVLGRKNLSIDEVRMLQIRTVRPKYDKVSGALIGHSIQMTVQKFAWDGMGGKYAKDVNICDKNGTVVPNGNVSPGDIVAATTYANMVYTGVGGDKFGIHWSFEDVSVVCQRSHLESKATVPVFGTQCYEFARPYEASTNMIVCDGSDQFSD